MGLYGIAKAFTVIDNGGEVKDLEPYDWLALLLDRETTWRREKRLTARLRIAKLRQSASVEDVDYKTPRGLDRALFQKLTQGDWIDAHDNVALIGPSGVGKSWLACAIVNLKSEKHLFISSSKARDIEFSQKSQLQQIQLNEDIKRFLVKERKNTPHSGRFILGFFQ